MPRSRKPPSGVTPISHPASQEPDPRQTEFPIAPPPQPWEGLHVPDEAPGLRERLALLNNKMSNREPQATAVLPPMPLYQIDRELAELLALEETLLQDQADVGKYRDPFLPGGGTAYHVKLQETEDALSAISTQIAAYVRAHAAKVDGIAYTIREFNSRAEVETAEAARHSKRASGWKAKATRLKDYVLRFMQSAQPPITRLEVAGNRLRVQANGGVVPLEITDAALVPRDMCVYTLTCGYEQLQRIQELADILEDPRMRAAVDSARVEPDTAAIRAALSRRVICPACNGVLDVVNGCGKCANTGTVAGEVPGARLLERGAHLRVE